MKTSIKEIPFMNDQKFLIEFIFFATIDSFLELEEALNDFKDSNFNFFEFEVDSGIDLISKKRISDYFPYSLLEIKKIDSKFLFALKRYP